MMITDRIQSSSTALFLCDLQEHFFSKLYAHPWLLKTAQKMITATQLLKIPLIVSEQNPTAFGTTIHELDVDHAIINETKTQFSLITPTIESYLKYANIKSVLLLGAESQYCILQSCLDLRRLGIDVTIVIDGVSSVNRWDTPIALKRMRDSGAIIATSDSILTELIWSSHHPQFKSLLSIVNKYRSTSMSNPLLMPPTITPGSHQPLMPHL